VGRISHLCHRVRLDCYAEAEVNSFCRFLLVLFVQGWEANLGFVLVLPDGSPVSLDSEEVRLVSEILWLGVALSTPV
jgi:hypothetical protein